METDVTVEENQMDSSGPPLAPSKTRRKREMHALQDIGEQMVQLDAKRLAELDLPEGLTQAVLEAKRMRKHGALRRQLQLIGKLMRQVDARPIQDKLDAWNGLNRAGAARLHQLERWRERLLTDDLALDEFAQRYPSADLQQLRTLVRNAQQERLANKSPRGFRALFRELQKIVSPCPASPDRNAD